MATLAEVERMRGRLNDLSGDDAGQRTEVRHPYSGDGGTRQGERDASTRNDSIVRRFGFSSTTAFAVIVFAAMMYFSLHVVFGR